MKPSIWHATGIIGLYLFIFIRGAAAQVGPVPVVVSLPELRAAPGATIQVPVSVSDITGLKVSAFDLKVTYDARILKAGRLITTGSLTEGWLAVHTVRFVEGSLDTLALVDIGLASGEPIASGVGAMLFLEFTVSDSAEIGQISPLIFSEAVLNSGTPQVTIRNGAIAIFESVLPGDFNGDCRVDFVDFLLFVTHFGLRAGNPRFDSTFDLDRDGQVNFLDFLIFTQQFGKSCSP